MSTTDVQDTRVFYESNPPARPFNLRSGWEQFRRGADRSLDGRTLDLTTPSGTRAVLVFADGEVSWEVSGTHPHTGSGSYDLAELRPGVLFIDIVDLLAEWSIVVTYVEATGQAVVLVNKLIARWGDLSMTQTVEPALDASAAPGTPYLERSKELTGKRALVRYEDDHAIEHIYVNSVRLAWVLLSGKNVVGNGNIVRCSYWKIAEGLFVFAFVETRPESVILLMDFEQGRNVGKLFARDDLGLVNLPAGALIEQFGDVLTYPEAEQPV